MGEELMDIYDENKNLTGRTIYRKDRNTLKEDLNKLQNIL